MTKKATETAVGIKTYTCTACKATKTETIPKLSHTHTYGAWTKADANSHKKTCTGEGCNAEITETHTWDAGKVTKEATEKETGKITYTCTECKATKTETIPKLAHTTHIYGVWTKVDENSHKQTCMGEGCNAEITETHTWDAGTVTKVATETANGEKTYICTACKATKTETIPKLAHTTHTYGVWTEVDANSHKKSCAECGESVEEAHIWENGKCKICSASQPEQTVAGSAAPSSPESETHIHTYGKWVKDGNVHKRYCSECDEYESEPHYYDKIENTSDKKHTVTCSDCGYERTEPHSWFNGNSDSKRHTGECKCGELIKGKHEWNSDNRCEICGITK